MARPRPTPRLRQPAAVTEAQETDRISGWLEDIHLTPPSTRSTPFPADENDVVAHAQSTSHSEGAEEEVTHARKDVGEEEGEDEGEAEVEQQARQEYLITPPRRRNLIVEEVSPTDTSFEGWSVFDSAGGGGKSRFSRLALRYGGGEGEGDDGERDDGSDTTSVSLASDSDSDSDSDQNWKSCTAVKEEERVSRPYSPLNPAEDGSDTKSLHHPIILPDDEEKVQANANIPRFVHLTSCLQCTLSHLPCSRTYPTCTRCARGPDPSLCLLRRRHFPSELTPSLTTPSPLNHSLNNSMSYEPILLHVKHSDEQVWKRKLELECEMMGEWEAQCERRNWVLPSVDGERGGWRKRGVKSERREGIGEGVGRVSFLEVVVDGEAEG